MADKLLEKMSESPEYLGPAEEPTFAQNFEQSEIPEYIGPIKPPEVLDYLKEPVEWAKMGMAGLAAGPGAIAKTLSIIPYADSIMKPAISVTEEAERWWEPKSSAPGRVSYWVRGALRSTGQSISTGVVGAALALASGGTGIPAVIIGAIASKGISFGGAQWYDLTKDIEREYTNFGATPEEIALIQKEFAAWKAASAASEVVGEVIPDFISARIFGLTGSPLIREPIKRGIMTAFGRFAKKMGWMQLSEGLGEQFTTAVEYKAAKEMQLPQEPYWKQVEDTLAITGIQTLIMGAGAHSVAATRERSNEAFKKDLKSKLSTGLAERGVDKDTADTVAESIIKKITKTDAADDAITELEERVKLKKATKEERKATKVEKKKAAVQKSKEVIQAILAPEVAEEIKPAVEEKPTAREEKLAKLKGEVPLYRVGPTLETAIRQPSEVMLPKQETTFIRLEPSENPDVPDVIVTDQSGRPAIFNPDIHVLTNQPEARRAIENWSPVAKKVETTRERRLRILREAGRIPPPQEVQKVAEAAEEVKDTATATEVVAIMRKLRPGFVEHVEAMSRKGWSIDDFVNDPDVHADLEDIVPEAKYYNLIMDIKEEIGAMTSTDIFDKQIRDEQLALDKDFMEIDKMKNEDLMQKEGPTDDEYYDVEQHKWIQLEKEEIVSNVENQFVEPPSAIEEISIVKQVSDKKIFSKKVENNTVWFLPKEEALTQLDLLKQTKLDWNSDVDTMLHALSTQINVAYHTNGEVPFSALSKFTDNLDHFKKILSHGEYDRLINSIDSLRRYIVDVSDALKVTDEPISPGLPRLEKYDSAVRSGVAHALMSTINSVPIETPIKATELLDFMLRGKEHYTQDHLALVQYLNIPSIRAILDNVNVITTEERGVPPAFYAGPTTDRGLIYGGAVIGFRFDYTDLAARTRISVGEDILHEITHALTIEILRTSRKFREAIESFRFDAIKNLPDNDRRILYSVGGDATIFHQRAFKDFGFSRGVDFIGVYYGLVNEREFISQAFTNSIFQQYLASIPYPQLEKRGPILTLWDKFKEALSWSIFNRPMGARESTLLDAVLTVGRGMIEAKSEAVHTQLAYEARERSINASTPRIKSIEVEQVLQNAPLKGSGIHAGLGTPIQQNVYIKESPLDISELATEGSPIFALRDHPDAQKFAGEAIDALGTWTYNRSLGFMEIDRITKDLNEREREKVTSILKEIESGEPINLDTLEPKIKAGVVATRKLFDLYKDKHKKFLRESLILGGNITEARILEDVLTGGYNVFEAIRKWNRYARSQNRTGTEPKIGTTTDGVILDLLKEWKEIENFGVKNYITRAMRGSIALIDPKGKIIAFAETKDKAVKAAMQYLKENPEVESIEVDTTYRMDKDFQTLVSQKYYGAMKGRIAKLVDQYAKDINKDLVDKLKTELPGRGIAIKPKKIWSQFLQEREEVLPGEKDVFDILPLYVHSIEKKHAIDPYIIKLRESLHKFSDRPNVKKVLEDQLEAMRGQYTQGDAIIDGLLAKLGIEKTFAYTRGLAATRVLITNFKLGYRPIAALVNLMSGMGHVWVKTSAKYMAEANRTLRSEGGREFIKKNAPSLGTSIVEGMGGDLENRLRWYSPLKLFQAPEIPNRELSFMTSYLFSRDKFGYDEEEAVEFAKRSVDTQEFIYNVAAIPRLLRGPTGRTVGQFKTYLIKEIEFIRGLKGANQWAKYLTMQAVLGGPRGIMITLKSLPFLMLIGGNRWLDDLDTWLNNNFPRLSRGVFGFFGIDASGPASFQFPTDVWDWAGIIVSDIVRFGKDVVKPIVDGESYIWEDIKKFTKGTIPAWRMWSDIFDGIMSEDGWILDDKNNNKYKVESWLDYIKMAGGFKPLKFSVQDLEIRLADVLEMKEKAQANKIVEQIVKRSRMIDVDIITEELVNEVALHAITPETIIEAVLKSHLDPSTRQLLATKLSRRMELWQRQLPMRKFRGY